MPLSTLFFDLDDTLYPPSTGLWAAIRQRINGYMEQRLGIPEQEGTALRLRYLETYGTTLRGLQHYYEIDSEDYLNYVHDLPLADYIQPNPALRQMLLELPQRRWIFTNADHRHAARVLTILGLEGCFDGVIDVLRMNFLNKPDPSAYTFAMQVAGEREPARCMLLDDAWRNLAQAKVLGMTTVLVHPEPGEHQADYHIQTITDLPKALPELWRAGVACRA